MANQHYFDLGSGAQAKHWPFNNANFDGYQWYGRATHGHSSGSGVIQPLEGDPIGPFTNAIVDVTFKVLARKSDNSVAGKWHKAITVKYDAASAATVVGAVHDLVAEQGSSGYSVTAVVSAGSIIFECTGLAATEIDWYISYQIEGLINIV